MSGHDDPESCVGEAGVAVQDGDVRTAEAVLAARFVPLAGSVVWSGGVAAELPPRTRAGAGER